MRAGALNGAALSPPPMGEYHLDFGRFAGVADDNTEPTRQPSGRAPSRLALACRPPMPLIPSRSTAPETTHSRESG